MLPRRGAHQHRPHLPREATELAQGPAHRAQRGGIRGRQLHLTSQGLDRRRRGLEPVQRDQGSCHLRQVTEQPHSVSPGQTALNLLGRRKQLGKAALLDSGLFASKVFRYGVSGQMLQQISLGGLMIARPIYLQMVFEYNALQAGLSLAPLSLTMFAVALYAGKHPAKRRAGARV